MKRKVEVKLLLDKKRDRIAIESIRALMTLINKAANRLSKLAHRNRISGVQSMEDLFWVDIRTEFGLTNSLTEMVFEKVA
ncbi:MAG: hypothetical protein Q8O19_02460, partial [Rectinemataceae bacterium]|nr:hypothetical protein [Rectinemataceae bacterium]